MSSHTHSYYEWQLATLMLAYDAAEPLPRDDEPRLKERQMKIEEELHALVHAVLPEDYKLNPQRDFPPELVIKITRATIARAAAIVQLT